MSVDLKKQQSAEIQISAGKTLNFESAEPAQKSYLARIQENNGHLALAIDTASKNDQLQILKTSVFLGDLEKAKQTCESLLTTTEKQTDLEFEVSLEKARIAFYEARWNECISLCNDLLQKEVSSVSRLTLFQVKAAALGESGEVTKALEVISIVESMKTLYPGGNVVFYASNQKAKLMARSGNLDLGNKLLTSLWVDYVFSKKPFSIDFVLILARTELEFRSLQGLDGANWGRLAINAAHMMGDQLFESLSNIECLWNTRLLHKTKEFYSSINLEQAKKDFARVALFLESKNLSIDETVKQIDFHPCEIVLLPSKKTILDFTHRTANYFNPTSPLASALNLLKKGGVIDDAKLFEKLYGFRYSKTKHSSGFRALLTRVRKTFGVEIESVDGMISLKNPEKILIIED